MKGPSARKISREAVIDLDQDIQLLEQYVSGLGKQGLSEVDAFVELRQSVNLMLSETWDNYLNIAQRMKMYNRLSPQTAGLLLER